MKKIPIVEILLVVIGTLLYFAANLQRVAVPGAIFDVLQQDLSVSAQCITALGTTFMYVYALSQLAIGVLVTKFGGFRIIKTGAILFFFGCILFPLTNSLPVLYFSRILIGMGSATFYIGLIDETKRIVHKNNFSIVLSMILLVGYVGGIVANAPLVVCVKQLGWKETFLITAGAIAIATTAFLLLNRMKPYKIPDKTVHFDLELFKEVFSNKKNIILYTTVCFNYGLYYVLQTVLGKKFLEDFCNFPTIKAAMVLSIMCALYALSGPITAFLSRLILFRKIIFVKIATFISTFSFLFILCCLIFSIKTPIIAVLLCLIAFGSNSSPLVVPLLHEYNTKKAASTSVSVMVCGFYIMVGLLGTLCGFLMDYFTPDTKGARIYTSDSYIAIFILMSIFALISFFNMFRISESLKTQELIRRVNHLKGQTQENMDDYLG